MGGFDDGSYEASSIVYRVFKVYVGPQRPRNHGPGEERLRHTHRLTRDSFYLKRVGERISGLQQGSNQVIFRDPV